MEASADAPDAADDNLLDKYAAVQKIEEALLPFCKDGKIVEWNGHFRSGVAFVEGGWYNSAEKRLTEILQGLMLQASFGWTPDRLEAVLAAAEAGVLLDEPLALGRGFQKFQCSFCGSGLSLAFNGQGFVVVNAPCPFPDEMVTEFELNVPSGKIVVDDDLRQWFPVDDDDHNLNALIGCHLSSLDAAKIGMAYGFVGNTSPGVYKDGSRFVIGNYQEEIWDEEKEKDLPNPEPCPWGEQVASICTDLWWYSIADFDEFERRRQHYTPDKPLKEILEFWTFNVVEVKPGVYKFRQQQGIDRDANTVEFASFEWVRDPDPVIDYLQMEKDKNVTATEALIQHCLAWPTLYMGVSSLDDPTLLDAIALWKKKNREEKAQCLAHAARQAMFTSRADDWHEKGFPRATISEEVHQFAAEYGEIPFFEFKHAWGSPSDDYDPICLGAGLGKSMFGPFPDLAPSFVLLGLNICQNAIKFGENPRLNHDVHPPAYEVPYARQNMAKFVEVYRGLRKKYPDIMFDTEFDAWMSDADLERHVAEFDFGPDHPPKEDRGAPPATVKTGKYFEFDAGLLSSGYFCGDPRRRAGWAHKESAKWFALNVLDEGVGPIGIPNWKSMGTCAMRDGINPAIPLRAVGRVLRGTGDGHTSKHLVVAFDYGTKTMVTEEFAFKEENMGAVRQFDRDADYQGLLETYKIEFAKA